MEIIRKTISIDNSRSHRNGLLPFAAYNQEEDKAVIQEVTASNSNGNYGQYVCDFAFFVESSDTRYGYTVNYMQEIARLKYLDVMRKYNFIQEQIRNGVRAKRFEVTSIDILAMSCNTLSVKCKDCGLDINSGLNSLKTEGGYVCPQCGSSNLLFSGVESQTKTEYRWRSDFESFAEPCKEGIEKEQMMKYDFEPLDEDYFTQIYNNVYVYNRPSEYNDYKEIEEGTRTESQKALIKKVDDIENAISANTYVIFIPNYDTVKDYMDSWDEWWNTNGLDGWEKNYFDSDYIVPAHFKFCSDMDKYVLGIVETVSGITGSKAPNYVYYTNFTNYINWFKSNSAKTATDENLEKIWNERGGEDFYKFVKGITPHWVKATGYTAKGISGSTFMYVAPFIDFDVAINDEHSYSGLYTPYEYSISGITQWDGTIEFKSPLTEGDAKWHTGWNKCDLSPKFITYAEEEAPIVESQLESLYSQKAMNIAEGLFGIYENFSEDSASGQLYKCTYYTGESKTAKTELYRSGTTYSTNGAIIETVTTKLIDSSREECPTIRENNSQIVGVEEIGISRSEEVRFAGEQTESTDTGYTVYQYWSASTWYKYGWWECIKIDDSGYTCGDGETFTGEASDKRYQNATIIACVPYLAATYKNGDVYYIMSKYENGRTDCSAGESICECRGTIKSVKIPFIVGEKLNISTMDSGEVIYSTVTNTATTEVCGATFITIDYVIGATSGAPISASGIHYRETLPYYTDNAVEVPIDGIYNTEIYWNYIDFDANLEDVYNEDYGLYRKAMPAKIMGMEVQTQWTSASSINTFLVTKEGTEGLMEEPIYDVNIIYDRGNAAAWEKHFKLSECNSLEDLENYNNGFFNL